MLESKGWILNPDTRSKYYHLKWVFKPLAEDYNHIRDGQYTDHTQSYKYYTKSYKYYTKSYKDHTKSYKYYTLIISKTAISWLLRIAWTKIWRRFFHKQKTLTISTLNALIFQNPTKSSNFLSNILSSLWCFC